MTVPCLKLEEAPGTILRDYQLAAVAKVRAGWATFTRQLIDAATGTGKSTIFAAIAAEEWEAGRRTLVLENRDALVRQTAFRIHAETGLETDIEMAGEHASPFASVVVASVPTLCRENRLTGFSDNHFGLLVQDEAHHSLAASFQKVAYYFHYGASSLAEGWQPPVDGSYEPKARLLGCTATPELANRRSLGEWFQAIAFQYQLIEAVHDGWLVPVITQNIPLKIDIRGLRPGRTPNGSDFKMEELSERLVPVLEALAKQIVSLCADRKTIAFVPSVECARILAAAVSRNGLRGIFVSGQCLDVDEKTEEYRNAGPGTVLCNCALYVEGADFPDTSCIVVARATKSTGFFRQMVGRGTRTLPGIVDGLESAEERRAAIAASLKPTLLILDPLWISDRIDLCDAYDLFTDKPEVKAAMKETGPATAESALAAERDFLKALEKEARKHENRQARTIDPLAFGLNIGDEAIVNYVPESAWELQPPSERQIEFMVKNHIDHSKIRYMGLAHRIIGRFVARRKLELATPHQLSFLKRLGFEEEKAATMTKDQASAAISQRVARWEGRDRVAR